MLHATSLPLNDRPARKAGPNEGPAPPVPGIRGRKEKDRANELLAQLYLTRERHRLGQDSSGFEHLMTEVKALAEPGVLLAASKIQQVLAT